ncbi:hypothetical protein [Kitasatospora sp. NPDC097643]|uniref:hypothetical protein n=1 Tax=Kitasatospora sp. NPDC097643 TaxID=3157230 RepID=UPI00332977A3
MVHNITSATRLLDLLAVFGPDRRVEVLFSCTGSSALDGGTSEFLRDRGMVEIPWEAAKEYPFDLAIATNRGGDLHALRAPLIGAPHGAGYNKILRQPAAAGAAGSREPGAFGLTAEWLMHEGAVVPAGVLLSHQEQLERLRSGCPEAVPVSAVVGDPCVDQLHASAPLRAAYRKAFGVRPDQKLVVASSTWGPHSLLGNAEANALRRVLAELPSDEFRVVAAVHPNAWYAHGEWQVHRWLADLIDCGLILPAPETESWKAALVAADYLVGDHGSVTLYGVSLGIPTLLGAFSDDTVAPGSPMEQLGKLVPRLSAWEGVLPQLLRAGGAQPADPELARLSGQVTSVPGESAARLRAVFYRHLGLDEPDGPAVTRVVPVPELSVVRPTVLPATLVVTENEPEPEPGRSLRVRRYPARLQRSGGVRPGPDAHLVADHAEPDGAVRRSADVLLVPADRLDDRLGDRLDDAVETPLPGWADWARGAPGCTLVAVERADGGCLALLPDGGRLTAEWRQRPAWATFAVAASVVREQLYDGTPRTARTLRVAAGPGQPTGLLLLRPC